MDIHKIAESITEDPDIIMEADDMEAQRDEALGNLSTIIFGQESPKLKNHILYNVIPEIQEMQKDVRAGDISPAQALSMFRIPINKRVFNMHMKRNPELTREQVAEKVGENLWEKIMHAVAIIVSQF